MVKDYWVVDVLHDISKFADDNGFTRLSKAMTHASDEFLDDIRDGDQKELSRLNRREDETCLEKVVELFQILPKQ